MIIAASQGGGSDEIVRSSIHANRECVHHVLSGVSQVSPLPRPVRPWWGTPESTRLAYAAHRLCGKLCTLPRSAEAPGAHGARCQARRLTGAPGWGWVLPGAVGHRFRAPAFPTPA